MISVAVLLPTLYVLSVGAVVRFYRETKRDPSVAIEVYTPLFWCADQNRHVDRALEAYLALWGVP